MKTRQARTAVTIAAATLALPIALTGCATSTNPSPTTDVELVDTTPAATAGVPELVWNLPYGEPTTLDPAFSSGESPSTVIANLCESLLLQNPDFSVSPNLAEVNRVNDTTYDILINPDATFWDGTPVTADDVKYSFERTANPELGSTWATTFASVDTITINDPSSLTVTLTRPDVAFYGNLAVAGGAIVQKKFTEAAGADFGNAETGVMCTGPYELGAWERGQSITLTKSADYWDTDRAALSDSVRFTFNTDAASATTALSKGEINGSFNFAISGLPKLAETGGTITYGPSLSLYTLMTINVNDGPLADQRVRQALAFVIDYAGIRDSVFANAAGELRTFTPSTAWGYSTDIFETAWDATEAGVTDLEQAKKLLDEAGGAPTDSIVLSYYADLPEDAQVAASVQSAAKSIGLNIELNAQTASESFAMYFEPEAREGTDLMIWSGYLDIAEPVVYYALYTTGGVFNVAGFSDPEFDQAVDTSRETLDDDARADLVVQAQKIYSDQQIFIPIAEQYTRVYQSEGITGAPASQVYLYTPWAAQVGTGEAK